MKKYTSHLLLSLALLVMAAWPTTQAKASHAAGGEIIYEHISDSTYRFFFKFYRDCTGVGEPGSQVLCCYNPCTNNQFNVTMTKYTGLIPPGNDNGSSVSAGCSKFKNKCDSPQSTLPGYREWWYTAVVTLNGQCDSWKFATWIGSRNSQNNITAANFYVETTFNNFAAQGNSSPYFSNKPIPYCCLNQPYSYNNGAVDPNGDSLTSEVINPLGGSSCTTPSAPLGTINPPGYPPISFPTNPLQSANTFTISATTGQLTFIPTQSGPSTLTVRTKEWRNGILIGSIMRDVQVQVLPVCSSGTPSFTQPTTNVTGGIVVAGQVRGCVGQPLSFTYDIKSSDTAAILIGSDNHILSIPGSNTSYTNQYNDSVRGHFSWTPGLNQTGLFTLTVTMTDSTCRPPGILLSQTYTIPVYIFGAPKASNDTSVCPGEPVQLTVQQTGANPPNYTWSIAQGPAGSLSCNNCQFPIASPYGTTTYVVASNTTNFCANNKDTVVVTMLPAPTFTKIADVETCPGVANPVDLQLQPLPGVNYTVQWTPGTYLSSNGIPNPVITPAGDITYYIVIGATNNTCKGFDTVKVDVLDGFRIITGDTAICLGDKVQVDVVGDSRYTFFWDTNDLSGGTSISNTAVINPLITPTSVGNWNYKLTASYTVNGIKVCDDSTASFDIDVQPIPTVALQDDASMCYGDTMQLKAIVTPADYKNYTYSWTPGVSLDNPKITNPIFRATISEKLTFTASTPAGCKDDEEIELTVFPGDFIFLSNDTAICPRDTASLAMVGNGVKSFQWSPSEFISNVGSLTPTVWPANTQLYTVYARDTNGCSDTAKVKVVVKPAAVIDLPESVRLYPGQGYQMDPRGNGVYFSWFPHVGLSSANISNPEVKPEVNTRYVVQATTELGCRATDSIDIIVSPDSQVDIPNVFAPGRNSTLKVLHLGEAKLKNFSIYNRWGVKMFETNDISQGWDGTYNGEPQPVGVYVYTIEAESYTGRKVSKQGNVTLIR